MGLRATPDPIHRAQSLSQIYLAADAKFTGRVTVPILWDKQIGTIVSNESADIIRMFNSAFDGIGAKEGDYYPKEHRNAIDQINATIYSNVNNGVYRCGFATTQLAYERAYTTLFHTLDMIEKSLSTKPYLVGDTLTEADWRLFVTLIRFDAVYVGHFKCNKKRLADYPNIYRYMKELYRIPGVSKTIHMDHIKNHYYQSHKTINPTGIVPTGPDIDFA